MSETCQCSCGYTCGGPGVCELEPFECLDAGHFVQDCQHDFRGMVTFKTESGAGGGSAACTRCGLLAIEHDMRVGP